MTGFGGRAKLTIAQQDSAISELMPLLIMGEQLLDKGKSAEEQVDISGYLSQLAQCVAEIGALLVEIEEGHSMMSSIDSEELEFRMIFLKEEILSLGGKIKGALNQSRGPRIR